MSSEASWIGREIRSYKVVSLLGKGGMGEVYRAHDTRLGRDVAIKVLVSAVAKDPGRRARFEREARALAALNHPNIGAIYGVEEVGDDCALVLELVGGDTLADMLHGKPLPFDRSMRIARQVCEAIEAAHDKGIVHRDLKPANIKITADGSVKVLDFGLAKALSLEDRDSTEASTNTSDGAVLGTPAYMSPEQARGQTLDKRSDVWAFGCVLYEMLTGRRAFAGPTMSDTIAAVLRTEPQWSDLPADVPAQVQRVLRRCLQKDPKRRLHDIADVRIELEDAGVVPELAVAATQSSGRPPAIVWIGIGLVLTVIVLGVIRRQPAVDPAPRLSRALRVTNTAAQEFGPAISPDGKWIAYYSNARGRTDLWVKFLDSGATLNLTASLNLDLPMRSGVGGVSISPDGATISFSARPDPQFAAYDIWLIPAPIGGVPRKFLQTFRGMQWSPDGKQIVAIRTGSLRGDALVLANSDGTNLRDLIPPQGGRHVHWPVWSRDGQFLYFNYTFDAWENEPSHVYRVPVTGGKPEPVVQSVQRALFPIPMPNGDLAFSGNPDGLDLGLWWRPNGRGESRPLTTGVGEHAEARLSADGRKLVATLYDLRQSLVVMPISTGLAGMQSITDGYTGDLDPVFDVHSGRIAFSSSRSGHRNLWLAQRDGSHATPLTNEPVIDSRPAFSPDGQSIAFVSDRGGRRGIWVMSTEGGAPKLLGATEVLDSLNWSPDAKRIFFAVPGGDLPRLASISVADGKIEPFSTPTAGAVAPAWSPKGDVLAYLEPTMIPGQTPSAQPASRLWLTFADSHGQQLYRNLPKQNFTNGLLAWSPDGKRLAAVNIPANGAASIWIVEPEGREPFKKLTDLPTSVNRPQGITWTADGSAVIFGKQEANSDIVLFDVSP